MTALVAGEPRRFSKPVVPPGHSEATSRPRATPTQDSRTASSDGQVAAYLLAVAFFGFTLAVIALVAVVFWIY